MNKSSRKTRTLILNVLCEGQSMRTTVRLLDVSFNTVTKPMIDAEQVGAEYGEAGSFT